MTAGQIKVIKAVFGEEIMTDLQEYGGDLHSEIITAIKNHICRLQENRRDEGPERKMSQE